MINKRYTIIQELSEGGMGKTFLANDEKSRCKVVVKMLHLHKTSDWKAVELFDREARTLKNLNYPHIPNYVDNFSEELDGKLTYYIVQEFINGENLEEKIKRGNYLTENNIFDIAQQLLDILAYLHNLRPPVIHRDINPKNIIINEKQELFLVDFGAVKDAVQQSEHGGSTVVGTYGFMPPEQMMGRSSPASDLYALGATIIYLLSHKQPNTMQIKNMKIDYKQHVTAHPRLLNFIDRCIEPDAEKRIQSAEKATSLLKNELEFSQEENQLDMYNLKIPFGSRMRILQNDSEALKINIKGDMKRSLPILGFSIFWLTFVGVWTTLASAAGPFMFFSIPFWIIGFFMFMRTFNSILPGLLTITSNEIAIKVSVLKKAKNFPLKFITRAEYEQRTHRTRSSNQPTFEDSLVIEAGAKKVYISKNLSKSEICWLEEVINTYRKMYT